MSKSSNQFLDYQEERFYTNCEAPYIMYEAPKPNIFKRILGAVVAFSDWVDDKYFNVPDQALIRRQKLQQDIEFTSSRLRDDIKNCYSLQVSYEIYDAINDFAIVWGSMLPQVVAAHSSLLLALYNRQKEITNGL